MTAVCRAFTLIELMVVISIIALMAGLLLALMNGSKDRANIERTKAILGVVAKGIALSQANTAMGLSPVEHPLAGSRAPRFAFRRHTPASDSPVSISAGALLDSTGMALTGLASTTQLPGGSSHVGAADLLLPSDLYADQASYLLFGLRRDAIGILGAMQKRVTKYIRLPQPQPGQASLSSAEFPALTTAALPDRTVPSDVQDVDASFGYPAASKQALSYLFGSSSAQTELSNLQALYLADPTTAANMTVATGGANTTQDNAFRNPINAMRVTAAATLPNGQPADATQVPLLYTDGKPETVWKPGCVYVSGGMPDYTGTNTQSFALASGAGGGGGGMWVHYRLPGLAIYDAWNVEVLASVSSQGGVRLMSAGPSGACRYSPGPNHRLDSTDPEAVPVGDDVISDAISVGAQEQP